MEERNRPVIIAAAAEVVIDGFGSLPRRRSWYQWAMAQGHGPVTQHQLRELQARRAPDRARDDLQGPFDAPRRLLSAVGEAAAGDVAERRHQVLPADFGHVQDIAVILERRKLVAGSLAALVERAAACHERGHLCGKVPEHVQGGAHLGRQLLRPSLPGSGQRLAGEQAVLAVHAPEVLSGQGRDQLLPHRRVLGILGLRPAVGLALLREARLLRVSDVLLKEVEGGAPRANGIGYVPWFHDEVLDVLPVLPPEV
mmetsp:Transcript_69912/g.183356  ORF Transcript_69912/g.183356 Transcript_69912/m.183356 type:complete len:255 (-) Transcript_69912:753-1517(-)